MAKNNDYSIRGFPSSIPSTVLWLITICNFSFKHLISPPRTSGMYVIHRHTRRKNSQTQKIKYFFIRKKKKRIENIDFQRSKAPSRSHTSPTPLSAKASEGQQMPYKSQPPETERQRYQEACCSDPFAQEHQDVARVYKA